MEAVNRLFVAGIIKRDFSNTKILADDWEKYVKFVTNEKR